MHVLKLFSSMVVQVEECGMKLTHQFPWVAAAYVAVGLALRRRELNSPDVPSSALKRKQITKVLQHNDVMYMTIAASLYSFRDLLGSRPLRLCPVLTPA